jgi:hypothetical protein
MLGLVNRLMDARSDVLLVLLKIQGFNVLHHNEFKAFTDVSEKPNFYLFYLSDCPTDRSLLSFDASVSIYQLIRHKTSEDEIYEKNLQNC